MSEISALNYPQADDLDGSFVETAFTNDQIQQTVAEERRVELDDNDCDFLADDTQQ